MWSCTVHEDRQTQHTQVIGALRKKASEAAESARVGEGCLCAYIGMLDVADMDNLLGPYCIYSAIVCTGIG